MARRLAGMNPARTPAFVKADNDRIEAGSTWHIAANDQLET